MERDISDFCFEANNPDDLPKIIEYAMNNKKIKLKQMHQYKEKMLLNLMEMLQLEPGMRFFQDLKKIKF